MKSTNATITRPRRRTARLHSLLALLCALVLLPLSASAVSTIPTTMRVALITPQDAAIYPLLTTDRDLLSMFDLVYESLVELNDERQPVPGLATSWEMLSDGRTWTFYLRQNVRFHDGHEVTAYDVAATMDAIKLIAADESLEANQKGIYTNLASVVSSWHAEDNYTLVVRTDRPCYGLLYAMTFPILRAQMVLEHNPPGSGPYRVEYFMPGQELWLGANPAWYGATPYVKEIVGHWYTDTSDALTAFEAEDVDIVMTRSTSAVRYRGTGSARASSYDYATRQLECLLINYSGNLKEVRMRQAIAHAIDKSRLVSNVYQNMVTATDTLQSRASWLYNDSDDVAVYEYNVEKANEILDALGWTEYNDKNFRTKKSESGETIVLEFRLNYYDEAGNSLRKEAANEIATMLKNVGINTRVSSYQFENGVQKLTARDYDLFLCAYNFDVVPDPNFILLSNGYGNYAGYRSDAMNKLCQELRRSFEAVSFQNAWNDIQALMSEEFPFMPLYWRNGVVLTRYPYSSVRDIREYELLKSINEYR